MHAAAASGGHQYGRGSGNGNGYGAYGGRDTTTATAAVADVAEAAFPTRSNQDAELGLAVDTRNYQALLQEKAQSRSKATFEAKFSDRGGMDHDAVVGLPIETRNYVALIGDRQAPRVVDAGDLSDDDDDAVLGLPASTGNYVAMLGDQKGGKAGVRGRGYSELANGRRTDRVGSTPANIGMDTPGTDQRGYSVVPRADAFVTAPVARGQQQQQQQQPHGTRLSCFDDPSGAHGVVPHSSWLYIKSRTFKTWKRYYATLSGLEFKYSSGPGHAPKGFGIVQAIRAWDEEPYGLIFVLTTNKQVPAYCTREADYDKWLEAVNKALDRQQTKYSKSRTNYVVAKASDGHEGYLYRQERNKSWKEFFFCLRSDGFLMCKEDEQTIADAKTSGYVKAVSFADSHPNGLAIQLDTGVSLLVYAQSYDDKMMWYAAMSSMAAANDTTNNLSNTSVKSGYVKTARNNYSGWLCKQTGLFKSWKRMYFTLHGNELTFAKDTNCPILLCDKVRSVEEWSGKTNGLQISLKSGRVWKVYAETYDSAKHWRTVISEACRHAEHTNIKRYLAGRKRKNLPPVFGGWLTSVKNGVKVRHYYVLDDNILGSSDDVDNQLSAIGFVVDVSKARDLPCGLVITLANRSRMKVAADSVDSFSAWLECLNAAANSRDNQQDR
ncbi:TPA: hypothetical protein N0F65_011696 [Lagenidium giganteum]|uniref:PH domain-containing protein n=1 Tax=Lagenidium giganteum TaxID=4803 RepID=A0AAV2YYG6_9STRA|nr:TPA: hypothetical protein N0F65_011696 [Lagenidium giganteum]